MVNLLGERILFRSNLRGSEPIFGTAILSFACALPVVGWFLLFPYVGFVGIGAFILGLFQRENDLNRKNCFLLRSPIRPSEFFENSEVFAF